jgi:GWxTD domain-containing protein
MMIRRLSSGLACLLFLVTSPSVADLASTTTEGGLEDWYRGPVRYLITRREEKSYRSLTNDAARILFIRNFWSARDPIPGTLENEARLEFWQRVSDAVELFRNDSSNPGWLSDRGRIYILLGPPNDIQTDFNFTGQTEQGSYRGLLRWIYHGELASGRREPTFVVAFVMNEAAEWRVTHDARLSSVTFDPLRAKAQQSRGPMLARIQSALVTGPSDLGVALDLARVTSPPTDQGSLIETIISQEFYGSLPVSVRWDFYPGPGDGRTLVLITAFVPRSPLSTSRSGAEPRPLLVGRLDSPANERIDLGEGSFVPLKENRKASPGDQLLYQVKTLSVPGTYETYVGVFDPVTFFSATDRDTVVVPAFDMNRLTITKILPARRLERVTRESDIGFTVPFVLGDLRVVPREAAIFPRSEGLAIYFQLAFPAGSPPSRLEMRFFRRTPEALLPVGAPQVIPEPQPVQGWHFPIDQWPPGRYRLQAAAWPAGDGEPVIETFDFDPPPAA